jgi:hypothetical protein
VDTAAVRECGVHGVCTRRARVAAAALACACMPFHAMHGPCHVPCHARCSGVQLLCRHRSPAYVLYLQVALTQPPLFDASRQARASADAALHVSDAGVVVKRNEGFVDDGVSAVARLRLRKWCQKSDGEGEEAHARAARLDACALMFDQFIDPWLPPPPLRLGSTCDRRMTY